MGNYNCLPIDKGEITVLFLTWRFTFAQTDPAKYHECFNSHDEIEHPYL